MILLSIIIPIYNAEKHISKCLNSILKQDQKNIEIICINDCSTDNSLNILKKYSKKHKNIKIINNKNNIKVGPTRIKGLKKAKGKYIWFVDADDKITTNALDIIMNCCKEDYEIIQFNYKIVNKKEKKKVNITNNKISDWFKEQLINQKTYALWNKIFEREKIKKENMLNKYTEDFEFCYKITYKSKKIKYIKKEIYDYYVQDNSITSNKNEYYIKGNYESFKILKSFLKERKIFNKYKKEYLKIKFKRYNIIISSYINNKKLQKKYFQKVTNDKELTFSNFLKAFEYFNWKEKIFWTGYFINKKMFLKIYKQYILWRTKE
jgi:glycosyltransferase involved in cell wall biosynthesis